MQQNDILNLIKLAKKQDADAFTELMQTNMQYMYKVGLSILMNDEDVADAIQDTILTCWEKLRDLKHDEFFRTWMTRILMNNCYAILNKRKNETDLEEWEDPGYHDQHSNIELEEALNSIPEKYRTIITLYYMEDMSVKEICNILGMKKSTVTTQLQRGRESLSKYFCIEE